MSVCLPVKSYLQNDKSAASSVVLPRVSSISSKFELNLLEAVICNPTVFPEKSRSSGFYTTLLELRAEEALLDLIASSTIVITILIIADKIASCTKVSTKATTLSTSHLTLPLICFPSVCRLSHQVVHAIRNNNPVCLT